MIELVEEEIKELLTSYKFPGDKTPIAKGSALAAVEGRDDEIGKNSIMELMKAVDDLFHNQIDQKIKISWCQLRMYSQFLEEVQL